MVILPEVLSDTAGTADPTKSWYRIGSFGILARMGRRCWFTRLREGEMMENDLRTRGSRLR